MPNNDNKEVLDAIRGLRAFFSERMDSLERRLEEAEKATKRHRTVIRAQQASIDELRKKVFELAKGDAVIWRSKDKSQIGVDRETAYRVFGELGYTPYDAMRQLDELGLIRTCKPHYTTSVKKDGSVIRAVVIYDQV